MENKKEKKEKLIPPVYKSFIEKKEYLAEQVYDPSTKKSEYLLFYPADETTERYDEIREEDGTILRPIEDEEVLAEQIGLPSDILEYDTDEKLDKEIYDFITEWLDIPEFQKTMGIYNIRRSWVFEKFHTLNYMRAMGDFGTGKSRFLDVFGLLHYKPIATSGALTSAVLFRVIDKWRGTLIIDEADMNKDDEKNDIIKIINQGYEKGKYVIRCDKEDKNKLKFFNVYCPKIIATRKQFADKATESRCITTIMNSTSREDIPPNLNKRFTNKVKELRNKLLLWRFRNYHKINPQKIENIDLGPIEPRLKQVSIGFVSMFADNKEEVERFKEYLLDYQSDLVEERSNTLEGVIVKAIYELLKNEEKYITAAKIIEQAELKDRSGELWKPRRLTSVMKTLGFNKPVQKKIDGINNKIYEFHEKRTFKLIKKYVPDAENISNRVTEVTEVTDTSQLSKYSNIKNSPVSVTMVTSVTRLPKNNLILKEDTPISDGKKETKPKLFNQLKNITEWIQNQVEASKEAIEDHFNLAEGTLDLLRQDGYIFESKPGFYKVNQ